MHGTIESLFRVEWRPLAELSPIAAEWRELAGRALEPNVFYEPAFALAAQPVFGRDIGAGLVWSSSSEPRLLGLFPARIERGAMACDAGAGRLDAPVRAIRRAAGRSRRAEAVIAVWFDQSPTIRNCRACCSFRCARSTGRWRTRSMRSWPAGDGRMRRCAHARALLAPASAAAPTISIGRSAPKKRRELRRQRRRLGDGGA